MKHAVQIIAHRGASHDAPENTLASVQLGWAQAADGVEIDIHLTRDGEVVAIHDPTLLRTTGRDANVDALTFKEIRKLDAGIWKGAAFRAERVPSLAEVLATVPAGKTLFIELKDSPGLVPGLQRAVQSAVDAGTVTFAQIVLISFEGPALRDAKRALPECRTLFIADTPDGTTARIQDLVTFCHDEGFNGLDVSAGWPIDLALVNRLHAEKLELHVWTVNDAARAKELVKAGVASITTDRPGWLREQV